MDEGLGAVTSFYEKAQERMTRFLHSRNLVAHHIPMNCCDVFVIAVLFLIVVA